MQIQKKWNSNKKTAVIQTLSTLAEFSLHTYSWSLAISVWTL